MRSRNGATWCRRHASLNSPPTKHGTPTAHACVRPAREQSWECPHRSVSGQAARRPHHESVGATRTGDVGPAMAGDVRHWSSDDCRCGKGPHPAPVEKRRMSMVVVSSDEKVRALARDAAVVDRGRRGSADEGDNQLTDANQVRDIEHEDLLATNIISFSLSTKCSPPWVIGKERSLSSLLLLPMSDFCRCHVTARRWVLKSGPPCGVAKRHDSEILVSRGGTLRSSKVRLLNIAIFSPPSI
ncbi:uncharacterized protein LY79DRAFT_9078 [Colletotrichum navitas]|uniref:Uncharacterized protein n=1 Tax=Colletotrichum navitas TaxID=681940 RepID=A0AAD8QF41_9PEZI|nr:uncharacterized protein LY79DRAFT_9078 [Colletotrichum navitas]KAK1600148.1 hypothetical protein LY79DRAFT_9078 [Colletotrichum navitas]